MKWKVVEERGITLKKVLGAINLRRVYDFSWFFQRSDILENENLQNFYPFTILANLTLLEVVFFMGLLPYLRVLQPSIQQRVTNFTKILLVKNIAILKFCGFCNVAFTPTWGCSFIGMFWPTSQNSGFMVEAF